MTFGEKIKVLRKEQGLSQEDLARKCGLNRNSIYKYEKNEVTPRIDILLKIARTLDVPIVRLYNFDDEKDTEKLGIVNNYYTACANDKILLMEFHKLNLNGQEEAIKRINELTLIGKYIEGNN